MITVEHLTKCYDDLTAVNDLSFEIEEGHVYGFLGPNGAGKSTTMNIMTGCLSATEGSVKIDGCDIFAQPKEAKKLIGYLPEQPPLYMNETPEEYLRFVGEAKGLRGDALKLQIEQVIELTRIESVRGRRISTLSKGYRQRVGIAQALMGDPRVIILDEPTVGLDPLQIIEIRELIKSLGREHTVIFSSHILSEVQAICDKILIIANGRLIAFEGADTLESRMLSSNELDITAETDADSVSRILKDIDGITGISVEDGQDGTASAKLAVTGELNEVRKKIFFAFADSRTALLEMTVKRANLEDVFIELAGTESVETEDDAAGEGGEEEE